MIYYPGANYPSGHHLNVAKFAGLKPNKPKPKGLKTEKEPPSLLTACYQKNALAPLSRTFSPIAHSALIVK